ncbi:MAG: sugar phosphate isomerase/epimerase [Firmicutes bacterium]|nr:sugar phosphate isomerase/epimerase [Bacillota bacterium]
MTHKLAVSGSTILSNPEKFEELFLEKIDSIEIGEFPDEIAVKHFLDLCKEKKQSFGIHSPLYLNESKYDLLKKVQYKPEYAWKQLELEAKKMSALGADYILVHFPYFKEQISGNANKLIEEGLIRLEQIQKKYSISIICEPKLGFNRSTAGINYLHTFPIEIWDKYNIKICIDIGDYLIATENEILNYLSKFKKHIKIVHLHNVDYIKDKHIWIPVHPSQETNGVNYKIKKIIDFLLQCKDITFVFEHTPHKIPSERFVKEGYQWVKDLIS